MPTARQLFVEGRPHLAAPQVLTALLIEILNIGVLIGVTGSITNAMTIGVVPSNNRRALLTYLPSEPIVYSGVVSQLSVVSIEFEHLSGLQTLYSQLKAVKTLTEVWVQAQAVEAVSAAVDFETVADGWQRLAGAAHVLILLFRVSLHEMDVSLPSSRISEILSALRAVWAGEHPCVARNGSISIPGWAERRGHQRRFRHLPVEVTSARGSVPAVMHDISATGLGLSELNGIAKGERLSVRLENGRRLVGTVVWSLENRLGLQLGDPLSWDDPLLS